MSLEQWMKDKAEQHAGKVALLESKFGYRFYNAYDVPRPAQTLFCVMMMSGGCESDNEIFLGVGETLDEAFEHVIHDIEEFFKSVPQLKKVPSVHDALKKL
jgi:hypothetical protein